VIPSYRPTREARQRFSRQCEAILARLQKGPATNRELAQLSLKYTSRLSEIRQAGYTVDVVKHDHKTGLVTYALATRGQMEMFG
jgi:hypothetical protein